MGVNLSLLWVHYNFSLATLTFLSAEDFWDEILYFIFANFLMSFYNQIFWGELRVPIFWGLPKILGFWSPQEMRILNSKFLIFPGTHMKSDWSCCCSLNLDCCAAAETTEDYVVFLAAWWNQNNKTICITIVILKARLACIHELATWQTRGGGTRCKMDN